MPSSNSSCRLNARDLATLNGLSTSLYESETPPPATKSSVINRLTFAQDRGIFHPPTGKGRRRKGLERWGRLSPVRSHSFSPTGAKEMARLSTL